MPSRVNPGILREGLGVLWVAVKAEPRVFALSVAASGLYAVMTVASAWVLGRATDEVMLPAFRSGETGAGALAGAAVLIVGVALLKALGVAGRRFYAGLMQYRMQARYRREVTRQYLRLPLAWHHRHPTGQLLSNANADVEAVWAPIAPLPMAVGVVFMLVIAAGALLVADVMVALVGFLVFPAIALLNVIYQRRLSPLAARAQQLRAEVSEVAHESFEGGLVVKTLGREDSETQRFAERARQLRDANVRVGRVRGLFDPLLEALPGLGVLAVLLVGTVRMRSGAMDAGDLVHVAYLFTLLAWPIRALGWVLAEVPRSVVGWHRVRGVLDAGGSLPYGTAEPAGDAAASLQVRAVRFGYGEDGDTPHDILHDVTFGAAAGRTVAIVGPTGSGKSTLTGLLVRLVDPADGSVLLDGVDVRDLRRGGVAATAALVPQQTFLFDDTVRGNVTLGRETPDEQVWEALRLAQADGFVAALPQGLDTRVGERGTTLSGGQRQRLALARALVRRPRLLVLDDATSSVDPQVEARILGGLREAQAGGGATVIVVAYRKATIALADEVVHLDRGRVVDRGTHEELLERSAGYRELVNAYDRAEAERAGAEGTEEALT
ncbi:ABC transporter ATP-binding protein [Actinomadura craniellae]|uniref:ABC transporter ATP-binding protein n=1 Tax=Actinomadura craniellae TaxID=2231787 RepID=UPI001F28B840|nr:ABC transporter ATP-binding protein [Actinomadura craniellae]